MSEVVGTGEAHDVLIVMAGSGPSADWYRNLQAHPAIEVAIAAQRSCRAVARRLARIPADMSIGDPGADELLAPGSDADLVWHLLEPQGDGLGGVQASVVDSVDVLGDGDVEVVDALPAALVVADQLGLEQRVERLGQSFDTDGQVLSSE